MFKALLLEKTEAGFRAGVQDVDETRLPEGDVLVEVEHSTLNYKDGLAITNKGPVVRTWPMVAGIDGAGRVLESRHPAWKAGDRVIHNGWGVGETRWGCLAGACPPLRRRPGGACRPPSRPAQAMAHRHRRLHRDAVRAGAGAPRRRARRRRRAGHRRHRRCRQRRDRAARASSGHAVTCATGKAAEADYLERLGARQVIDRAELAAPGKPLQKERWAAVVDAVGSHTLVNALAQTRYGGVVAACGLAQGADLPGTVMPFILRGVTLAGIDSVMAPLARRREAWMRLARDLDPALLDAMTEEVALERRRSRRPQALMQGRVRGRIVVADLTAGSATRGAAQRISLRDRAERGCAGARSTRTAPSRWSRRPRPGRGRAQSAASRSCGRREPTASATHFTWWPDSSRRDDRLQHADMGFAAGDDQGAGARAGRRSMKPGLLDRGEVELGRASCRRARAASGTLGPRPVGVLLGADDVDAAARAPRARAGCSAGPRPRRRGSPASAAPADR